MGSRSNQNFPEVQDTAINQAYLSADSQELKISAAYHRETQARFMHSNARQPSNLMMAPPTGYNTQGHISTNLVTTGDLGSVEAFNNGFQADHPHFGEESAIVAAIVRQSAEAEQVLELGSSTTNVGSDAISNDAIDPRLR
jgi:predicted cupin superfamily sugar epimerase